MGFGGFTHGAVAYPLTLGTQSLLQVADPTLFYTIDYFASVLQTYAGAAFVTAAANANYTINGAAITKIVQYVQPHEPTQYLNAESITFPLLAVWREKEKWRWEVNAYTDSLGVWNVAYVLAPMSKGQAEKVKPILNSIPKILNNRIENMFDPNYTPPANGSTTYAQGTPIWGVAGVEEIYLDEVSYGKLGVPQATITFPAVMMTLRVSERDMPIPDAVTDGVFGGIDFEVDNITDDSPAQIVAQSALTFQNPASFASGTLVASYRSDVGVTSSSGTASAWADQSGTGATLTATGQPALVTNDIGSQKIIRFDGNAALMTATVSAMAADTAKTIVALFRLYDVAARSSIVLVTNNTTAGTLSLEANTVSSAGGKLGIYAAGSSFDTQFNTDLLWHSAVITVTASSGSIAGTTSVSIDGLPATLTLKSGTGTWATLGTSSTFAVGGLASAMPATAAHADLGLALAFTGALSVTDQAAALAYCQQWLAQQV